MGRLRHKPGHKQIHGETNALETNGDEKKRRQRNGCTEDRVVWKKVEEAYKWTKRVKRKKEQQSMKDIKGFTYL